uniref:FAD/NAD(P)-binding domain-containing protein n=1 Tax=Glossina brevipalpis TaxID=37001 RepID=A0A1A9W6Z9_9MUSC
MKRWMSADALNEKIGRYVNELQSHLFKKDNLNKRALICRKAIVNNEEAMKKNRSECQGFDFDLICIGVGSGGLACAKEAVSLGAKVACLDFVRPTPFGTRWGVGGTCVNVGCIPKKHMHQAALLGNAIEDASHFGWSVPSDYALNWKKLVTEIQNNVKSTNWLIKVEMRTKGITYFNGIGSFIDQNTLKVKMVNGSEQQITGKFILIAIGNRPVYPKIPGALEYGITSDDLFSLSKPPGKTLCVGAGYVSMECAGFLNELGFNVTVMARAEILSSFDQEMATILKDHMASRGVTFLQYRLPKSVEQADNKQLLVKFRNLKNEGFEEQGVFDTVIWAMGRRALLDDINFSAINLTIEDHEIVVNDFEQTSVPNIFAVGDVVKGKPKLTPVAVLAGRLVARRLFAGADDRMNYENIPTTLFTPLEYSFVGITEGEALRRFEENGVDVHHGYYNPIDFILTGRPTSYCYIKVITRREEPRRILGIHFIGPNAGEIVQGFAVAINCGLTMDALFSTVGVNITNAAEITKVFITKRSGLDPSKPLYGPIYLDDHIAYGEFSEEVLFIPSQPLTDNSSIYIADDTGKHFMCVRIRK